MCFIHFAFFATQLTNRNQDFFYFWACPTKVVEREGSKQSCLYKRAVKSNLI